jgi:putative protease
MSNDSRIALSIVEPPKSDEAQHESEWQGWRPVHAHVDTHANDAPEPDAPQGEYVSAGVEAILALPGHLPERTNRPVELLAPAGGMEAALAALHFGADAIYLGLKKFSARAEAENFTLAEVDEITAYAHCLQPRRRVFVTINTLVRQDELAEVVADIAQLAETGVDAIILQDLGVYHLLRKYFPQLERHASTQMSVHNDAGAQTLHRLGFRRVVLARELTFEEVHDITATAGVETEVFIHGALCYSYSGLCLFSSQTLGRSGNRGKCAYSCRDSFDVTGAPMSLRDGTAVRRDPRQGFPFSMKDLALPDHLPALRAAGVSCFKIEGRKKSPLYVASTTDYYRRLLDGRLSADERPKIEKDIQTVFSRPWTWLFVQSHKDKEVADRDTVGHRGTLIGKVERVLGAGTREPRLRFRTSRALQRHDGLQIDLPVLGKPFGFAVEHLWVVGARGKTTDVIEVPAGALVEVSLPREQPDLPVGAPVYCSSSQEVKQRYRYDHPKAGLYRQRKSLQIKVRLTATELVVVGSVDEIEAQVTLVGQFPVAREPGQMVQAVHDAFAKLGNTPFQLGQILFENELASFVPVSRLNQVRRDLIDKLDMALRQRLQERIENIQQAVRPPANPEPASGACQGPGADQDRALTRPARLQLWSIKVDRIGFLDAFNAADLADLEEAVVEIACDPWPELKSKLEQLVQMIGRERIRLALPPLTRRWEDRGLRCKIDQLRQANWDKWEAANLSAWSYLGLDPAAGTTGDIDLGTDWSIYVLNRLAVRQLLDMGVRRFTLSPEDGLDNLRSLLAEFAAQATVIVYQDTPLFLAESCAYANLIGGCPGKANCRFESMDMISSHGERVTALDYHCRTIVLNQGAFCLSAQLPALVKAGAVHLRADFVYRKYPADEVRRVWQLVRSGKQLPQTHAANFHRGIL